MKIVDLTLPYSGQISGFSHSPARELSKDGWNATTLQIYSHAGTHMDAPIHFGVGDRTIDQFDVSDFVVDRVWVVDLTPVKDQTLLGIADLGEVANTLQNGDGLFLRTDWYQRLGTEAYRNKLPRIGEELAQWMVARGVSMLGVEAPSVADVNNLPEVTRIHQILLGNVIIVEGLGYLDQLQRAMVKVIALPLKIKDGDGAPCRVIAFEE
ncbi:arylformamidase [Dyadobacter jejuensis]|uniref:Arylformamidase n=1 Tax=Dyadobacter jejuensis TaxID=1082580 RepID=A0A316AGF0_9BACT|nr:cyclase family protein [Dyadobacter jejuensis]PWJ56865.1 arylformamidase [Dyadobacter jejuensis]